MLIDHEGLKLKPYYCTGGRLTIGVGRNLGDLGITEDEAMFLLDGDIDRVERELWRNFPWMSKLSPNRRDALIDMCFNLGISRFKGFKRMLKAIENERWETAACEMIDSEWARQVGRRAGELAQIIREG
jgi:lysozyme